jgi:hypothetical protein
MDSTPPIPQCSTPFHPQGGCAITFGLLTPPPASCCSAGAVRPVGTARSEAFQLPLRHRPRPARHQVPH